MKTANWQTKALALFIAGVALCLTAACAGEYTGPNRITPSAPCGDDTPLVPSNEYREFQGIENPYDVFGQDRIEQASRDRAKRLWPEKERIWAIMDRYGDLVERQSHVITWGVMDTQTEDLWLTDKLIIEITLEKYVDQNSFPPEDRIPECMDGVEVHFDIAPYLRSTGYSASNNRKRS